MVAQGVFFMRKILVLLIVLLLLGMAAVWMIHGWWADIYYENVMAEGEKSVRTTVNQILAETVYDRLDEEEFFTSETDAEGNLKFFKVNSRFINSLAVDLNESLQEYCQSGKENWVYTDMGALVENSMVSRLNLGTEIKCTILSVENINCRTEYKQEANEQNRYSIYCNVTVKACIRAPFIYEVIKLERNVLLQEAVMIGSLPESCLIVPGEDLLEVA